MPKEEVYVDDEAEACCPDVKCPYCGGELGYNPIGKIEHYEEAETEEVDDDEEELELPEEGEEEEVEEVEEEEEVKESLQDRIRKNQLKESRKLREADDEFDFDWSIGDKLIFNDDDSNYGGAEYELINIDGQYYQFKPLNDAAEEYARVAYEEGDKDQGYEYDGTYWLDNYGLGDGGYTHISADGSNQYVAESLVESKTDAEKLDDLIAGISPTKVKNAKSAKKPKWKPEDLSHAKEDAKKLNKFIDEGKKVCPNCGKDPCVCEGCDKKEELTEGVNNLSLDTDDQHLEVQTDETGRISVVSEPTAGPAEEIPDTMTPGEDSVVPLDMGDMDTIEDNISPEDQDEILNAEEEVGAPVMAEEPLEGEEPLEEPVEGEEEEEFDFETESFNYLGNTFAKKLYENVASYETTSAKEKDDNLVVEGLIKFNSGKMKPTRFIFECVKKTNTNRLVFEGLNETFFPKKAFRLRGKLSEGKLISESLRYNYTINKLNESTNSPEPVSVRGIVRGK